MFGIEGIIQMLLILVILYFISGAIVLRFNLSSIKIMLLGIALIVFSDSVLKGMIKYGIDNYISMIGLSFCIVGFCKKDK